MAEQNQNPAGAAPGAAPQTPAQAAAPAANGNKRRKVLGTIATVFALAGGGYALYYFLIGQYHAGTDDAYVNGNLVYVNTQVNGTVTGISADDTQTVKTGQALINLDPSDSAVALADAEAKLGETVRQIRQQFRAVDEAKAVVEQRQTDVKRSGDDLARRQQLAGSDALSAEDLEHARNAAASARDALAVAEKQLASAQAAVEGTSLRKHPSVLRARAEFAQSWLTAQRAAIVSPIDGVVARRTVQIGQRVAPGSNLMAIVPLNALWVDANLKEVQLENVRIGQPAKVSADIYGSHFDYHGTVAGISAGTGGAFSLLPPQNAVGNWIKVVQRVPVRIALDPKELEQHPLRVGMSTVVDIDTHDRSGSVLTALPIQNAPLQTTVFDAQLAQAEKQADAIIAREAGKD